VDKIKFHFHRSHDVTYEKVIEAGRERHSYSNDPITNVVGLSHQSPQSRNENLATKRLGLLAGGKDGCLRVDLEIVLLQVST
jgi:hypothetical protein